MNLDSIYLKRDKKEDKKWKKRSGVEAVAEPRFQFRGGKIEKKNTKNKSNLKLLIDNKNKINREL